MVVMGIPAVRRGHPPSAGRPDTPDLVDRFGRVARDLRVSITEKCSVRCTYCMPEEGLPAIPAAELLSAEEIVRVVGLAVLMRNGSHAAVLRLGNMKLGGMTPTTR